MNRQVEPITKTDSASTKNDPSWGNFGSEINNLLNSFANYAKERGYSADEMKDIFNAGIVARRQFLPDKSVESEAASPRTGQIWDSAAENTPQSPTSADS